MCRFIPAGVGAAVVALGVAAIVATTYQANAQTLVHYAPWNMTMPAALDAGLLRDAREGASIYLDDSYPAQTMFSGNTWDARYYLYFHTGKRFRVLPLADLTATANEAFAVRGTSTGFTDGTAIAGPVAGVVNVDGRREALVEKVTRFERVAASGNVTMWKSRCGPVTIDSVLSKKPTALVLSYGPAFYSQENDASAVWRWASGNAEVDIENPTSRPRYANLQFTIRSLEAATRVRVIGIASAPKPAESGDISIDEPVRVSPNGHVSIRLVSKDTPRVRPPDTRPLLFQIRNVNLVEPACT
jgi:hypothetical protein